MGRGEGIAAATDYRMTRYRSSRATYWLRSGGAKTLEQEELDPKTPIFAALVRDQS
jgi:hypothetical protein